MRALIGVSWELMMVMVKKLGEIFANLESRSTFLTSLLPRDSPNSCQQPRLIPKVDDFDASYAQKEVEYELTHLQPIDESL